MNVQLIFRHPHPERFSIEKVFSSILPYWQDNINLKSIYLPCTTQSLFSLFRNLIFTLKLKADRYIITGDVHYVMLVLPPSRTILCIHDLVFMRQAKGIKRIFFKWLYLIIPVHRAREIITISEKSKQEILSFVDVDPNKISVIPDPVSDLFFASHKEKNRNPYPVILFPGTKPNKNLERTIHALKGLSCKLIVLGKTSILQHEIAKEYDVLMESVFGLDEEQLVALYCQSDVVLFPSLYEGFGLPILEAFASGTPLITSDISPMKDIAEDAAFLCDPYSVDSIRNAIVTLLQDNRRYRDLVERGRMVANRYKASAIADKYLIHIIENH